MLLEDRLAELVNKINAVNKEVYEAEQELIAQVRAKQGTEEGDRLVEALRPMIYAGGALMSAADYVGEAFAEARDPAGIPNLGAARAGEIITFKKGSGSKRGAHQEGGTGQ